MNLVRIHTACTIDAEQVVAVWSEMYADPKLDKANYLTKVCFKNGFVLTVAGYDSKDDADQMVHLITDKMESYV